MNRFVAILSLTLTLAGLALGQTPAGPTFEVASVLPCKPGTPEAPGQHAGMVQYIFPGGRFKAAAVTPMFLMEWAYSIQPAQHSGGPAWMESDRFDIEARAAAGVPDARMREMVQTLLADRFGLKLKRETKTLDAIVISEGKGPLKISKSAEVGTRGMRIAPRQIPGTSVNAYRVEATHFDLDDLTSVFARQMGRIIVNHSGLAGDYDFTLDLSPDPANPNPLDPALLLDALRTQLGFAVASRKEPIEFLSIEDISKPTAN